MQWPALMGQEQYEWEPARTVTTPAKHRSKQLRALGNSIVPAQVAPIFAAIYEQLESAA